MVGGHHDTWEDHVRSVCMAYNTSLQPTTGYSPFFLMFGRKARLPIELAYGTSETATHSPNEYAAALQKSLGSAFEQVRKNFKHKLYRQKAFYDCKVNGQHYERDVLLSQKGSLTSCTTHGQAPIALRSTCTTKQYGWCSSMALNLGRILSVRGAV